MWGERQNGSFKKVALLDDDKKYCSLHYRRWESSHKKRSLHCHQILQFLRVQPHFKLMLLFGETVRKGWIQWVSCLTSGSKTKRTQISWLKAATNSLSSGFAAVQHFMVNLASSCASKARICINMSWFCLRVTLKGQRLASYLTGWRWTQQPGLVFLKNHSNWESSFKKFASDVNLRLWLESKGLSAYTS